MWMCAVGRGRGVVVGRGCERRGGRAARQAGAAGLRRPRHPRQLQRRVAAQLPRPAQPARYPQPRQLQLRVLFTVTLLWRGGNLYSFLVI
jgi:hypothetical protein